MFEQQPELDLIPRFTESKIAELKQKTGATTTYDAERQQYIVTMYNPNKGITSVFSVDPTTFTTKLLADKCSDAMDGTNVHHEPPIRILDAEAIHQNQRDILLRALEEIFNEEVVDINT